MALSENRLPQNPRVVIFSIQVANLLYSWVISFSDTPKNQITYSHSLTSPANPTWSPCGYGSIPINTIISGMNIHLPAILGFTRYQGFDPSPCKNRGQGTGLVGQSVPSVRAVDFNDLVARETFPRDVAFGGEEKLIPWSPMDPTGKAGMPIVSKWQCVKTLYPWWTPK